MLRVIFSYAAVYIVWGTTYFFIKQAISTVPPLWMLAIRYIAGAVLLGVFAYFRGAFDDLPARRQVLSSVAIGVLLFIGGNGLLSFAELRVDSYLAALIVSTGPVVVLVFDWLITGIRVRLSAWFGVIMGLIGVVLLLADGSGGFSFSIYIMLLLAAILLFSLGISLSKVMSLPSDGVINSFIQLLAAGLLYLVTALIVQPPAAVDWAGISMESWLSISYLSLVGTSTIVCFIYLLKVEPNYRVVTYCFVNPLIAAVIGIFIGGEKAVTYLLAGTVLILCGLAVIFYGSLFSRSFNRVFRR